MNFFSFFNKSKKTGSESTVASDKLIESIKEQNSDAKVVTMLSFHPSWDISQEQEYVFRFLSNELEDLDPYQLSLSGIDIDIEKGNGDWLVKAFFRSSVPQDITMGKIELILSGKDQKTFARKEFDFNELGDIPPNSARPWIFVFEKETQLVEEPPQKDWTLNFNVQSLMPHSLDLDAAWDAQLSNEQKESLQKVVDNLPKLKPSEVNFVGFQTNFSEEGNLNVSLFIRNGHEQTINLEKLPLEIIDATGQIVCRGSFDLPPLSVKPNTSKPWTFIFPKETIQIENPDFSRWTARVPQ